MDTVLDMPGVLLRQVPGSMVQKTVVVPQLQLIVGRRHSFRAAEADLHGFSLLSRSWRFCSSCLFWWSMSLLCESCRFSGAAVEKTLALPQLQLVEKSDSFYCPLYLAVTCSVFAFCVQVYGLFWEMTSGCFPYSALFVSTLDTCYVSLRRLLELFHTFLSLVFQRNAWFDGGFLLMRQTTEAFTVHTAENCGVSAVAVRPGRRHLFRSAEADPHGPGCLADHRDSPVAVRFSVVDALVVQVVQVHFPVAAQRFFPWSRLSVGPQVFPSC